MSFICTNILIEDKLERDKYSLFDHTQNRDLDNFHVR